MEDDEGPPRGIEAPEGVLDRLALHDVGLDVAGHGTAERRELDFNGTTPTPAQQIDTGSDQQPMQPGLEPRRITKTGQVPPGVQQRVLNRVPREFAIPEDEAGGCIQPRDGRASQDCEGVMIAPLCLLDETPLVHCRLWSGAATWCARMVCRTAIVIRSRATSG